MLAIEATLGFGPIRGPAETAARYCEANLIEGRAARSSRPPSLRPRRQTRPMVSVGYLITDERKVRSGAWKRTA
jgi:hypothetical protein